MIGILLSQGAKVSPVIWVFLVGVIVLMVYLAMYDKKNAKKFDVEFEK